MVRKVSLNEIKTIVKECVTRLLLEAPDFAKLKAAAQIAVKKGVSNSVGSLGPLQLERGNVDIHDGKCHLVALSDIMGQSNGNYNTLNPQFDSEMRMIHKNYATAMAKHYPNSVRDFYEFSHTALNRRWAFTDGNSFIFVTDFGSGHHGSGASGYWVATHFAPDSNMGGYKLLKELFMYDNIIMPVTEHMWNQLAKMGLFYPELSAMVRFAGGYAEKMFFTSDRKLMESEILKGLIKQYQSGNTQAVNAGVMQMMLTKDLYNSLHGSPKGKGKGKKGASVSNPLAFAVFDKIKDYIKQEQLKNGNVRIPPQPLMKMMLIALKPKIHSLKQTYGNIGVDTQQLKDDVMTLVMKDSTTNPYVEEIYYITDELAKVYDNM